MQNKIHLLKKCRLMSLLLLLALSTGVLRAAEESKFFSNPVFAHDWADPTVWQGDDGLYYTFSTAGAKYSKGLAKFLWSEDMVRWDTIPDYVWTNETLTTLKKYGDNIWAPQIVKLNGKWLMYVTCYTSERKSSIAVLTLDSETFPTSDGKHGPWKFHSVLTDASVTKIYDTIDPYVVQDPETGKVWLFFGGIDKIHRVELASDGLSLAEENPTYTHVAGLEYSQDATRGKVFEAVYLYKHDDYWYMFVSSGLYSDYSYNIKVGRSASLDGEFLSKTGKSLKEGLTTTILSTSKTDTDFWGPGHTGEIIQDIEGRFYMFYHCHGKDVPVTVADYTPRALMLQQMYWAEDGWPYFEGGKPLGTEACPAYTNSYHDLAVSSTKWATVYVPFAFEIPEGMEVYTVQAAESSALTMSKVEETEANTPYLVYANSGTYALSGYARDTVDLQTAGLLVGTHNNIQAPAGSYVFENGEKGAGFYAANASTVEAHTAYLLTENASQSYYLCEGAEGLESISANNGNAIESVYSLSGQKVNGMSNGISIIRMSDGTVKKVVVIE